MPATPAWLAGVEVMLNRGADASPRAADLARRLESTALQVHIEGLTSIRVSVVGGRISLATVDQPPEPADATIRGTAFALLHLARGGAAAGGTGRSAPQSAADVRAHAARTTVSGDAEIANSYRQLFAAARPDPEEELSRIVGDLPARRLSQFVVRAAAWARKARRTAGENIAEYLQEESRDLVNRPELEEFLHGVDAAREAADRVEARLARLERQLKGAD